MKPGPTVFSKYGYAWITAGFFLMSLAGHWLFGWFAYVNDQIAHSRPIEMSEFWVQMGRDTLENWQSASHRPAGHDRGCEQCARRRARGLSAP